MRLFQAARFALLWFAAIWFLSTSSAQAVLLPGTLGFTDGNGTDCFDQYQGQSGGEWLEAWVPLGTITASVVDATPLGSGGNYLSLADVGGGEGVTRQFLAPTTYSYRLMLDLRVDDIPTSGTINLSTGSSRLVYTNDTNYVQARAYVNDKWRFDGDGTTEVSTISLVADTTYHFDFLIDPVDKKYTATVSDGSNSDSTDWLSFRNQTTLAANPFFELGAQTGASPYTFSLDNVAFAPEPSSHFTDGGSGSDWSTADNWDDGAPTAQTFAHIGAGNTATLSTAGAEAFQVIVGHTGSTMPGSGTLNQTGGDLTVTDSLLIGVKTTGGSDVSGTYTSTGGTLTVGSLAQRGKIILGYNSAGNTSDALGTLDLAGASQFDAYLDELTIGEVTSSASSGTGGGTLKLAPTTYIDATEIMVSWSNMHSATQPTSTIELGANTTIKADTFTVAGFRGMALVEFGAGGGTLTLSGSGAAEADLLIANCDGGTNNSVNGHMDMSGGAFNATLDRLLIGYDISGTNNGGSVGKLTFSDGVIAANSLTLGDAGTGLGNGTLDMSGGSLTVNGDATLGTGTDVSLGAINLTGGTLAVTGSVTGGIGTSTLNVDGGAMTVGGDLIVDTLRVGYHTSEGDAAGRNASVITAGNGSVQIGSETERTNLYVGHTNQNLTEDVVGVLNLSGSASFTAYLNSFIIGQRTVGLEGYNGDAVGTVTLPDTSYIDATSIMISDQQMWIGADPSTLTLGANSTFKVNLFTVGANRANARLEFASGGTLTLGGPTGSKADLRIGYQTLGTGSTANSTADFSGGTLNATLDELVIGYANGKSTGGGKAFGAMLFSGGAVTANSVKIGDANASVGTGTGDGALTMSGGTFTVDGDITLGTGTSLSKGAINLSAGTLAADSITQGVGTGIMNFTGGTLHVDAFGSEARPFDLVQAGGTLAPGDSPGMTTIYGDYTMNAGALEIEINGLDQGDQGLVGDAGDEIGYDHVLVDGDASLTGNLNVLLLDDFAPELGSHFDVLQTTGSLDIAGLALNTDLAPLAFGWWEMSAIGGAGGEGGILRLSAVPEPSGVLLLILALLLGYARRSRQ